MSYHFFSPRARLIHSSSHKSLSRPPSIPRESPPQPPRLAPRLLLTVFLFLREILLVIFLPKISCHPFPKRVHLHHYFILLRPIMSEGLSDPSQWRCEGRFNIQFGIFFDCRIKLQRAEQTEFHKPNFHLMPIA